MQFRGAGSAVRMGFHPFHEWLQPVIRYFNVRIYQDEILCFNQFERLVVTACKSVVCVKGYCLYLWELLLHHFQ